ncbi:MAG: hypothetical protein U0Q16_04345 [Bryobacteraceae bacterium]
MRAGAADNIGNTPALATRKFGRRGLFDSGFWLFEVTAIFAKNLTRAQVGRWKDLAGKITALAAALPDDRIEWNPAGGVLSYGALLRHMAFWNG